MTRTNRPPAPGRGWGALRRWLASSGLLDFAIACNLAIAYVNWVYGRWYLTIFSLSVAGWTFWMRQMIRRRRRRREQGARRLVPLVILDGDPILPILDDPTGWWFDRDGQPISMRQWGRLRYEPDGAPNPYIEVDRTQVGGYFVSTVWLGFNENFNREGPPLIFETMVFGEGPWVGYKQRYSTEIQALAGHDQVCASVRDDPAAVHYEIEG